MFFQAIRQPTRQAKRTLLHLARGAFLLVVGLFLYGWELYNALLLLRVPSDSAPLSTLAVLLLGFYAFRLARAWQPLGGRTHGMGEWLSPLHTFDGRQPAQSSVEPGSKLYEYN